MLRVITWLADKFNLAGRIHRRDAEFAEVFIGFLGVLCASAVNHEICRPTRVITANSGLTNRANLV